MLRTTRNDNGNNNIIKEARHSGSLPLTHPWPFCLAWDRFLLFPRPDWNSLYLTQVGLKLTATPLTQFPKCYDFRHETPSQASKAF